MVSICIMYMCVENSQKCPHIAIALYGQQLIAIRRTVCSVAGYRGSGSRARDLSLIESESRMVMNFRYPIVI